MKRLIKSALFACVAQTVLSVLLCAQQPDLSRTKGNLPVSRITPGVAGNCLTTDSNGNTAWGSCASGSGTVTGFSSGNLAPIFTTSVSNAGTTPSLAFTLTNASAHTFLGNDTGVSAAPGYVAITAADLPGSITSSTSGNAATATALASNPADCSANNYAISIDASGNLTCAQVAYSQVTGTPVLPVNTTATASNFFTAYNSTTGAFTKATIANGDLPGSGAVTVNTTSPLGGGGSVSLGNSLTLTCTTCLTSVTAHNLLSATHGDTAAHTVLRGDLIAGIGVTPSWTAVAKGGTNTYPKWNSSGDVVASTNPASGTGSPTSCTNQFVTAFTLNADSAPTSTCSTVSYSQVSGTPTLEYQTVQDEGTPLTQRATINFTGTGVTCSDNAVSSRTDCAITSGGGSGTVTNTLGALTAGQLVIGNGGADVTVGNLSGDASTSGGAAVTVTAVNGTSVPTNAAADQTVVTTASATGAWKSLPNCTDSSGNHLNYDTSTHSFSCGASSSTPAGMTSLGCASISVNGTTIGPVSVSGQKLFVPIMINGYAGSDTASLQFNGSGGTAYRYRWLTSAAGGTTFAAGLVAASTDRVKIGAANTTNSRNVDAIINNSSAVNEKLVMFINGQFGTGSAATQSTLDMGNGAWVSGASTTITSISIISTSNMLAGSKFCVYQAIP